MISTHRPSRGAALLAAGMIASGALFLSLSAGLQAQKPAAEASPATEGTKIAKLPFSIAAPGKYFLSEDLELDKKNTDGITIKASDVEIDLRGHSLKGPDANNQKKGDGIAVEGAQSRVTIKTGKISRWAGSGIALKGVAQVVVEDVEATGNGGDGIEAGDGAQVRKCKGTSNGANGIQAGDGAKIDSCDARSNGNDGIKVGANAAIDKCEAISNGGDGVQAGDKAKLTDVKGSQNGARGIKAGDGADISACKAKSNGADGIQAGKAATIKDSEGSSNGAIGIGAKSGSTVTGCEAKSNGADGIHAGEGGKVTGSTATGNGGRGIDAPREGKSGNKTKGNGGE